MNYKDYKAEHTTLGCKITHIIGIPLIIAAIVLVPCDLLIAGACLNIGIMLQFIGHTLFEGNNPVLLSDPKAIIYGIVFVIDPQTYRSLFK